MADIESNVLFKNTVQINPGMLTLDQALLTITDSKISIESKNPFEISIKSIKEITKKRWMLTHSIIDIVYLDSTGKQQEIKVNGCAGSVTDNKKTNQIYDILTRLQKGEKVEPSDKVKKISAMPSGTGPISIGIVVVAAIFAGLLGAVIAISVLAVSIKINSTDYPKTQKAVLIGLMVLAGIVIYLIVATLLITALKG